MPRHGAHLRCKGVVHRDADGATDAYEPHHRVLEQEPAHSVWAPGASGEEAIEHLVVMASRHSRHHEVSV
jgi:hypothetical protein